MANADAETIADSADTAGNGIHAELLKPPPEQLPYTCSHLSPVERDTRDRSLRRDLISNFRLILLRISAGPRESANSELFKSGLKE